MIVGLRGKATAIDGVSSIRSVASAAKASGVKTSCPSSAVISASKPAASAAAAKGPASRQRRIGIIVKTRIFPPCPGYHGGREGEDIMYVGTQIRPRDDSDYRVWAQLGVRHVCVDPPGNPHHWGLGDLCRHKDHIESFGLSLDMVQLPLSSRPIEEAESPNILLGKEPERQREIDGICGLIERLAAAGIPAAKYNLCIIGIPRTAREAGRGGSRHPPFPWGQGRPTG